MEDRSYHSSSIVAYAEGKSYLKLSQNRVRSGFRSERRGAPPTGNGRLAISIGRGFARYYDRRRSIVLNSKGRFHLLDAFSFRFARRIFIRITYLERDYRSSPIRSQSRRLSPFKDKHPLFFSRERYGKDRGRDSVCLFFASKEIAGILAIVLRRSPEVFIYATFEYECLPVRIAN